MWRSGDVVALRDLWFGKVWRAVPGIVVEDVPARSAFYLPPGVDAVYPADESGREIRIPTLEFVHARRLTTKPTVAVYTHGEPWSIWHFFDGVQLAHWYVNFESPVARGERTFDYVDHKLDLIVRPDDTVEWKDEDELEEAARRGLLDAAEIRRDAERVLAEWPFPTGWEDWRPDPAWPVPALPRGWDVV